MKAAMADVEAVGSLEEVWLRLGMEPRPAEPEEVGR
jgi:hypothetical protein